MALPLQYHMWLIDLFKDAFENLTSVWRKLKPSDEIAILHTRHFWPVNQTKFTRMPIFGELQHLLVWASLFGHIFVKMALVNG